MRRQTNDKPLLVLKGKIATPPLSQKARIEAGYLLRKLQQGESVGMPLSRPMPEIGRNCHELRIVDSNQTWRIIYRIDHDAIVIAQIFSKKSRTTPKSVIDVSKARLRAYDQAVRTDDDG